MKKITALVMMTMLAGLILGAIAPRYVSGQNLGSSIKVERLVFLSPSRPAQPTSWPISITTAAMRTGRCKYWCMARPTITPIGIFQR